MSNTTVQWDQDADGHMYMLPNGTRESIEALTPNTIPEDVTEAIRLEAQANFEKEYVNGWRFMFERPEGIPAVWGEGNQVLWAEGESLVIAGGQGTGKTSCAANIARGRLGLSDEFLGLPVAASPDPVLYLAMDRPSQTGRALRRVFSEDERDIVERLLFFRPGPPPSDTTDDEYVLLRMANKVRARTVIVDSIKDAAIGLSEDKVGAAYNRARQHLIKEGIQVLELHHTVKRGADGGPPKSLQDVYGSTWITSGAGSVIGLHGDAGSERVAFTHLKQPGEVVGPWTIEHDHTAGTVSNLGGPKDEAGRIDSAIVNWLRDNEGARMGRIVKAVETETWKRTRIENRVAKMIELGQLREDDGQHYVVSLGA